MTTTATDPESSTSQNDHSNQQNEKQQLAARYDNTNSNGGGGDNSNRNCQNNNDGQRLSPEQPQQQQTSPQNHRTAPDSIHEDLFYGENAGDTAVYSKEATLSSNREEDLFVKASWRLKLLILLCMLALPVGCHYLEATVGTLKTALKHVSFFFNKQISCKPIFPVFPLLARHRTQKQLC